MEKYSISETLSNIYAFVITKLFFPKARLIRRPVYLRGRKSLDYGAGLTLGHACRFDLQGEKSTLRIGRNCSLGDNVHIVAFEKVSIGDNVLMASKIFISDTNHGCYRGEMQDSPLTAPNIRELNTKPVTIGNNVWLGENVVVLQGVTIGDGCIIGANSVVLSDVEENTIAVGSPAHPVKRFDSSLNKWVKL